MLHPANQRVSAGAKMLLSHRQNQQQLFHLAGRSIQLSGVPLNTSQRSDATLGQNLAKVGNPVKEKKRSVQTAPS